MAAPSTQHQPITGRIYEELYYYLKKQKCEVMVSPFDIIFPEKSTADKDIFPVRQPNICVVCDVKIWRKGGCLGAVDIVIEVLLPANAKKELEHKFNIYDQYNVKEY